MTHKSGFTAAGPYDIDNIWIDSCAMYTNMTPAGALRGFGMPQLTFAYESHTDMVARALNIDPLEFRRKNVLRNGRPQATGTILKDAALEAVLEHVADRLRWSEKFDRGRGIVKRGRGIAFALKACVSPTTSVAIVNVSADGSPTLYISTVDMGQGSDTGMAQIVGEVLNVPAESVRVVARDTDVTPYDMGTLGSRSMFHMGHAVRLAAEEARQKIDALRREVGEPEGSNTPVSGLFIKKYGMKAGNIVGSGSYRPGHVEPDHETGLSPEITPFWMVAAAGAEIEIDTETGRVRILRLINAVDCGTGQSAHRRDADFRCGPDATRLHHVGEDELRRRPGHQCVARRLQDHRHRRSAGRDDQRGDRRLSAQRAVWRQRRRRNPRPCRCRRQSPTRLTTQSASA